MNTNTAATIDILPFQSVAEVDTFTAPFLGGYDPVSGYRAVGGILQGMATLNQNQH